MTREKEEALKRGTDGEVARELDVALAQSRIALKAFGALPPGVAAHLIEHAEKARMALKKMQARYEGGQKAMSADALQQALYDSMKS